MRSDFALHAPLWLCAAGAAGLVLVAHVDAAPARIDAPSLVRPVADTSGLPPAPKLPTSKIPTQQGKAKKGEAKVFADGKLSVLLSDIQPHGVRGAINGGEEVEIKSGSTRRLLAGDLACELSYLGPSGDRAILMGGCAPATDEDRAKIEQEKTAVSEAKKPAEVVASAPEGSLRNPYAGDKNAAEEGHKIYLASGCNGCHGGTGGGGMCPPLTNDTFVYGAGDDVLFRLITNGSEGLLKTGHTRIGRENVVGPMPPFADIIQTDQDLWKIIAFIRSVYAGDPARAKDWRK